MFKTIHWYEHRAKKKWKKKFKKDFKMINTSVFGKTMGNIRKHRDIKLITTKARRNTLVWFDSFYKDLLAIEIKITQVLMNKPFCLGLSVLEISNIVIHKFWCDYVKPKYGEKLYYMDTESFI